MEKEEVKYKVKIPIELIDIKIVQNKNNILIQYNDIEYPVMGRILLSDNPNKDIIEYHTHLFNMPLSNNTNIIQLLNVPFNYIRIYPYIIYDNPEKIIQFNQFYVEAIVVNL